jgi:hypothetical protein
VTADLLAATESLGLRDAELDETGADFLVAQAKAADGARYVRAARAALATRSPGTGSG